MFMMNEPIIECVPNFSEGRDMATLDAIEEALRSVGGVHILHRTSDADHHRSVFTLIGDAPALLEGLFRAITVASERIDLDEQRGEHPRMGATDVVPFIPIANVTMRDCVALAHQLGERVGRVLGLPVYLYEEASTRPERRNLADVRRGGYEHLRHVIHLSDYAPDYGEARVGKAGAVIIGARDFLIAYNVFLDTPDVGIARNIARAIREANGGLVGVKALGMLVGGRAQVSMNIVNYRTAPLYEVMARIQAEAGRYGVGIERSELIGLIPQRALIDVAMAHLRLDADTPTRILEDNIRRALSGMSLSEDDKLDS